MEDEAVMVRNMGAVVLAAGKGTRIGMKRSNKVLLPLAGKPMIMRSLSVIRRCGIAPILIVVGFQQEAVKKRLGPEYVYVDQGELLGTGHAVAQAVKCLDPQIRDILVVNGDDSAFYDPTLLQTLIERHRSRGASLSLLSVHKNHPSGFGRIIRDDSGDVSAIREETDASQEEKAIDEVNTGTYCFSVGFLREFLPKLRMNARKGEYYLTDLVELAYESNQKVETVPVAQEGSFIGINTREDLAYANIQMKKRRRR